MPDAADLTTLANVKQWLGLTGLAIASVTLANPAVLTLQTQPSQPLISGAAYTIAGGTGLTQINGDWPITVLSPMTFSIPLNASLLSAYTGGAFVAISDPLLANMITRASVGIQSWLNRTIRSQEYTEVRNGTGGQILPLQQFPVSSVSLVTVNGLTVPPRPAMAATVTTVGFYGVGQPFGYTFDESTIYLSGAMFCRGFQNVQVQYVAGYPVTPYDIEQACIDTVGDWVRYMERIGKTSQGIEGQTTSFTNVPIPVRALSQLQQYRKVAPIGP